MAIYLAVLIGGTSIANSTKTCQESQLMGGCRTSCLFTSAVNELKIGITVLQIQLVVRAGIERGTSDSKYGILATRPRDLITHGARQNIGGEEQRRAFRA